jgi:hypothetical protein
MKAEQDRLPRRMLRRPRKLSFAVLAVLAVLALSACGNEDTRVTTGTYAGESGKNAPYLNVGPLIYQVQLSRELNPYGAEDEPYMQGLTPAQRKLEIGQEWFGVFIQVYNETNHTHLTSDNFAVSDTQANVYYPIVPAATNPFAYRGGLLEGNSRIPALGSIAADGPSQGALLLFKIQIVSLDNRPLKIHIVDPTDPTQTASAELDV